MSIEDATPKKASLPFWELLKVQGSARAQRFECQTKAELKWNKDVCLWRHWTELTENCLRRSLIIR